MQYVKDAVTRDTAHCIVAILVPFIVASCVRSSHMLEGYIFDCLEMFISFLKPRKLDWKEWWAGKGVRRRL